VLRHTPSGRKAFVVDVAAIINGEDKVVPYLQARDIVYVPRTRIARLNLWIRQHINEVIPNVGARYTITEGNTTFGVDMGN
jgi:hypothetical protein